MTYRRSPDCSGSLHHAPAWCSASCKELAACTRSSVPGHTKTGAEEVCWGTEEEKKGGKKRKRQKMKTKHCKNERYHGDGREGEKKWEKAKDHGIENRRGTWRGREKDVSR